MLKRRFKLMPSWSPYYTDFVGTLFLSWRLVVIVAADTKSIRHMLWIGNYRNMDLISIQGRAGSPGLIKVWILYLLFLFIDEWEQP